MKTNTRGSICHLTKYVVLFFIILLLQSCASTSGSLTRLEGSDFDNNLPGLWEGRWFWGSRSGKTHLNVTKIDGNNVILTGFSEGGDDVSDSEEVYATIENSALLITWPEQGSNGRLKMSRDDLNNIILDGRWENATNAGKVQLSKVE